MEYEAFKNKMREKLQERMGSKGEVKVIQLKENNGGLRDELAYVVNDNNLTPGLWLEDIYELSKEYSFEECLDGVEEAFNNRLKLSKSALYKPWEEAKEYLQVKVINAAWNKDNLKEIPHINYLDLAIIFTVGGLEEDIEWTGLTVKYEHLKKWGIELAEFLETAIKKIYGEEEFSIRGVDECLNPKWRVLGTDDGIIYVMTNKQEEFGATAIVRVDLIREFANKVQSDLYIIPSSLHEILLIPTNKMNDRALLKKSLKTVNQFLVKPSDCLSENIYYFDRQSGSVEMIDE